MITLKKDHEGKKKIGKLKEWKNFILNTFWTGGATQAVECLLCKSKALSSNPSPNSKNIIMILLFHSDSSL
jgi:hypothetical protein